VEREVTEKNRINGGAIRTDELHKWLMELFLSDKKESRKQRLKIVSAFLGFPSFFPKNH
jgi:hypothetical protein